VGAWAVSVGLMRVTAADRALVLDVWQAAEPRRTAIRKPPWASSVPHRIGYAEPVSAGNSCRSPRPVGRHLAGGRDDSRSGPEVTFKRSARQRAADPAGIPEWGPLPEAGMKDRVRFNWRSTTPAGGPTRTGPAPHLRTTDACPRPAAVPLHAIRVTRGCLGLTGSSSKSANWTGTPAARHQHAAGDGTGPRIVAGHARVPWCRRTCGRSSTLRNWIPLIVPSLNS